MKKYWSILALSFAVLSAKADTIVLWDFDYPAVPVGQFGSGDTNSATGTFTPNGGSGSITNIGTTTNSFGTPPAGGASATSDTDISDNSALRLGQFPANTTNNNLTAGVQAFASTVGYENVVVTWDQENSASASKYWRFQYTIDHGSNWINNLSYTVANTTWVQGHSVDLSAATGVRNNPNFGFRIVSECVFSAAPPSTLAFEGQAGTVASYSTSGTLWLDMVTVSGTVITSSNTAPTITAIANQSVAANSGTLGPIAITIGDAETAASALTLSANSSNPTLVQISDVTFGGSGASRTVSVTPETNQFGTAQVTVTVTDGGGLSSSSTFTLTVRQPTLVISNVTARASVTSNAVLQITDVASFKGTLSVTADSTNTALLPDSNITISGSGASRTVAFAPVAGQTGVSLVTITATDGGITATNQFYYRAVPTNTVVLWDFNSKVLDLDATSGSLVPIVGTGTAGVCGGATNIVTSLSAADFDPETLDNSKWRIASFPTQSTADQTGGVEFHVNTTGYQNIAMSLDQYGSATSSRYFQVQYTLDGVNYSNFMTYSNTLLTTFYSQPISFGAVAGANNNANFGVRIVAEFENDAIGNSNLNYVANQATNGYSPGGTVWIDDVGFTGDPYVVGGNTPPVISSIADQNTAANITIGPLSFMVSDAQTAATSLTVTATSSNPTLIANGDITLGGSGTNRTITIHPEANQLGTSQINLVVSDGLGGTNSTLFNVNITTPVVTVTNQTIRLGSSDSIQISVGSFLGTVNVSLDSSNTTLLPDSNISITGSGSTRTITLNPVSGQLGASLISLVVSNATFTSSNGFYLHVVPANTITLWDFNSAILDLDPNTGNGSPAFGTGTIVTAGGTTNSINSNVSAVDSDPETADNSKLRFGAFPSPSTADETGGVEIRASTVGYQNIHLYFDQYNSASASQFWQVQYSLNGTSFTNFLGYTNTLATTFFTNAIDFSSIPGASNNVHFAVRIVAEYQSTATGSGPANYLGVSGGAYGSAGTLWLDDVIVTGDAISGGPSLKITAVGNVINITWPTSATGATLQSTTTLNPSNWQNVSQTPVVSGTNNVVSYTNATTGNLFFRLVH